MRKYLLALLTVFLFGTLSGPTEATASETTVNAVAEAAGEFVVEVGGNIADFDLSKMANLQVDPEPTDDLDADELIQDIKEIIATAPKDGNPTSWLLWIVAAFSIVLNLIQYYKTRIAKQEAKRAT